MSLRAKLIRLAHADPELRSHLLLLLKSAGGISLGRMKDRSTMTFSPKDGNVYVHVWLDMGVASDDFGRHVKDSGEWQVIVSTSSDPLNQKPRGKELARKEFRFADPRNRGLVQSSAEDYIKKMLFKHR